MPQYRVYHLDGAGRVSSTDWLDADGDQAAIGAASECNTLSCELWQGRRLVTRLAVETEKLSTVAGRSGSGRPGAESRALGRFFKVISDGADNL